MNDKDLAMKKDAGVELLVQKADKGLAQNHSYYYCTDGNRKNQKNSSPS